MFIYALKLTYSTGYHLGPNKEKIEDFSTDIFVSEDPAKLKRWFNKWSADGIQKLNGKAFPKLLRHLREGDVIRVRLTSTELMWPDNQERPEEKEKDAD